MEEPPLRAKDPAPKESPRETGKNFMVVYAGFEVVGRNLKCDSVLNKALLERVQYGHGGRVLMAMCRQGFINSFPRCLVTVKDEDEECRAGADG